MAQQAAAVPSLRVRGGLDNKDFWTRALGGTTSSLGGTKCFTEQMFTNINLYPFDTPDWTQLYLPTLTFLGSIGREMYLKRGVANATVDFTSTYVAMLGEWLAPCISTTSLLNMADSRTMLVNSVKSLLKSPILPTLSSGTKAVYDALVQWRNAADADRHQLPVYIQNIEDSFEIEENTRDATIAGSYGEPLADDWPADPNAEYNMTAQQGMRILFFLTCKILPRYNVSGLDAISHILVSVVKRGIVTTQYLWRVQRGIYNDLHRNVVLDEKIIRLCYSKYGNLVDETNIERVFNRWRTQIPPEALRLVLTVQIAAGGGLTVYFTVMRALSDYHDFDWPLIALALPEDWTNFRRAVNIVGNNQFYGYRKDLGQARSTLYKNLGWVAKELRTKIGGDTFISGYACWPGRVPNQDTIVRAIEDYKVERTRGFTPDKKAAKSGDQGLINLIDDVRNLMAPRPPIAPQPTPAPGAPVPPNVEGGGAQAGNP